MKIQLFSSYKSHNYRAPKNDITRKLPLLLIGRIYNNMLHIIRSTLACLILCINVLYSFIHISLFFTSKCYLRDTHTMRDIPPFYPNCCRNQSKNVMPGQETVVKVTVQF